MNKLGKSMMALSMVGYMIMPVIADEKTTTLTASKPSTYELTIPATTKIIYNSEKTELKGLKVTGDVKPGSTVTVKATKNALQRKGIEDVLTQDVLIYNLKNGDTEFEKASWNEAELRAGDKEIPLSVNISKDAWASAKAGDYTGSITFNATLDEGKTK